jgi:hypothetical protein
MNQPLSIGKYYYNNQKQVTIVFLITCFSVILQYALLIYVTTMLNLTKESTPWEKVVYVYTEKLKQPQLQQALSKERSVSQVLPVNFQTTSRYGGLATILLLNVNEIQPVLDSLKLNLIKGRSPAPGTHEIILHWKLAALKGLKIGDYFGNKFSKLELLEGEYQLVGLIDGDLMIGFADLDAYITDYQLATDDTAFLVVPQKGQFAQVNSYLACCAQKDPKLATLYKPEDTSLDNCANLIINIIYLVITGIVAICVSFLFYLYFFHRRPECGLLEALGHSRQMIVGKAFLEISGINFLGCLLGVGVGLLSGWALNSFVLTKHGLPLVLWKTNYTFKLLSIPIFITLSSILPVWRLLKKVDPISIIEEKI